MRTAPLSLLALTSVAAAFFATTARAQHAVATPVIATADTTTTDATTRPPAKEVPRADTEQLQQFEKGIEFAPKDPSYKVAFSLEDADLGELVRVIGELTGKRFVVASSKVKSFKATVFSPQKITVAEAYRAFLSILQSNGLTVIPEGAFSKIVDTQDVTRQGTPLSRGADGITNEERYVTRIHRLKHVAADEVATNVLAKFQTRDGSIVPYAPGNLLILTDTGENIRRMMGILEEIDVSAGAEDQVWLEPLFYVPAADVAKRLSEVFDGHVEKLVALDRPNALVFVGTRTAYLRALELIKRIDLPTSNDQQIHVVALQHADAKKIVGALNDAVGGSMSGSGPSGKSLLGAPAPVLEASAKISAEETTNSLIVTSSLRDYGAIRDVITQIDKPRRQVYIEAVVMDLSVERTNQLGVAFHGADLAASPAGSGNALLYGGLNALGSVAAPSDPTSLQAFALGVRGPDSGATIPGPNGTGISIPAFGVLISAAAMNTDADILSTPHILASDNTPAEIKVQLHTATQKNFPVIPTSGGSSNPLAALQASSLATSGAGTAGYADIGPRIKVTPHLNESDEVRLDIEESISDIAGSGNEGTLGTVSFLNRAATTTLTVKDQETVVIGGLVRDKMTRSETKVPLLGDIPVIGALFRSSTSKVEKSNLVLVLTPYIIREQADLRHIFERKMQERQEFLDHYMVFSEREHDPPKDFLRTQGLLGGMIHEAHDIEEKRNLDDLMKPGEVKTHEPVVPLDMPTTSVRSGAAAATGVPTPKGRAIERVEK